VTRLLDQLSRLFVEPQTAVSQPESNDVQWLPPGSAAPTAGESCRLQRIGVVCSAREARTAGGAAALALAHVAGAPRATVLEWVAGGGPAARDRPSAPAVRRRAARLRDQGFAASSVGRLVRVDLPEAEARATEEARAVLARADGPSAVVVAAARGPETEQLLAELDRILLMVRPGADANMAAIALAALQELSPSVAVELSTSPVAATAARSGSALVAPLRAPLLAALRERL